MSDSVEVILARIETKLDRVVSDFTDHEIRIRGLEKARWILVGAAAVTGGAAGTVGGFLSAVSRLSGG